MKRVPRELKKKIETLIEELSESGSEYTKRVEELNEKLVALNEEAANLQTYHDEYADKNTELVEAIDELVSEMEDYESNRSEKWSESDAAAEFQEWKDSWSSFRDEIENACPSEPDFDIQMIDVPEVFSSEWDMFPGYAVDSVITADLEREEKRMKAKEEGKKEPEEDEDE